MSLFGRKSGRAPQAGPSTPVPEGLASAGSLPEPDTDWRNTDSIRAEWVGREERSQGRDGWNAGKNLFEQGVIPVQRMNTAEYMARALVYHLFPPPLLTDGEALETCRRILIQIDGVPAEPAWMTPMAAKLSRLALAVIRDKGWQPSAFGGDDSVTKEILRARPDGLVHYSARCPGVGHDDTWAHFFSAR